MITSQQGISLGYPARLDFIIGALKSREFVLTRGRMKHQKWNWGDLKHETNMVRAGHRESMRRDMGTFGEQ